MKLTAGDFVMPVVTVVMLVLCLMDWSRSGWAVFLLWMVYMAYVYTTHGGWKR